MICVHCRVTRHDQCPGDTWCACAHADGSSLSEADQKTRDQADNQDG